MDHCPVARTDYPNVWNIINDETLYKPTCPRRSLRLNEEEELLGTFAASLQRVLHITGGSS